MDVNGGMVCAFFLALCGNKGFMVGKKRLVSHFKYRLEDLNNPRVCITLLWHFTNEDGCKWHLMLSTSETKSSFKVRKWDIVLVKLLKF